MNKKGGYKIVSCVSPTIYNDIEGNYGKPILLTDIVISGVEKADVFVTFELNGTDFVAKVYDNWFVVSDDNTTSIDVELVLYDGIVGDFAYDSFESGKNYLIVYGSEENSSHSSGILHCALEGDRIYLYTTLVVYDDMAEESKIATYLYKGNDPSYTFYDMLGDSIGVDENDTITIYKI